MTIHELHRREEGQTLVVAILALVALLGVLALAIDGGYAYSQRRQMQNAADAAAMAGAWRLAMVGSGQIDSAVAQYATANGADSYGWTMPDSRTVRVTTQVTFDTFFARLLGLNSMTASAESEATAGAISRAGNLLPMTIEEEPFVVGQSYTIWDNAQEAPGGFGWVDWNGVPVGNPELADNICNPDNSGAWDIGAWLPSGPGVENSAAVRQCLNTWLGSEVTIPIYDDVQGNGANARYRISGFARFVLEDYSFTGHDKYVEGRFVRSVAPGELGDELGAEYELKTVDLTR